MDKIWVVSIVYSKQFETKISHALRSTVLYAKNKDEALGTGIRLTEEEFKEDQHWSLYLKAVVEVTEFVQEISKETLNT